MATATTLEEEYPRLAEARALLEERGILSEEKEYTPAELARELVRRGWSWNLGPEEADATKAYIPKSEFPYSIVAAGTNPSATLTIVLADAVLFDEEHHLSLTGPYQADIVVQAPDSRVIALLEVKNSQQLTSEFATILRRDRIVYDRLDSQVPFFLLVSQDVGYLWDRMTDRPFDHPRVQFPMAEVVRHYLPGLEPNGRLGGWELTLVVSNWLKDLALRVPSRPRAVERHLKETEFVDEIVDSTVTINDRE